MKPEEVKAVQQDHKSHADRIPLQETKNTAGVLRPVVRLKSDGAETVINCPWNQKLSLKISKEAPAAVAKCIDGGPGVEFDFRGL
jgi:hypothetical protein